MLSNKPMSFALLLLLGLTVPAVPAAGSNQQASVQQMSAGQLASSQQAAIQQMSSSSQQSSQQQAAIQQQASSQQQMSGMQMGSQQMVGQQVGGLPMIPSKDCLVRRYEIRTWLDAVYKVTTGKGTWADNVYLIEAGYQVAFQLLGSLNNFICVIRREPNSTKLIKSLKAMDKNQWINLSADKVKAVVRVVRSNDLDKVCKVLNKISVFISDTYYGGTPMKP